MTESDLAKSLYVFPWHVCSDGDTQYLLIPPRKGTNGWVQLERGRANYSEKPEWTLDELGCIVNYCPWCGEKLPTDARQPF